MNRRFTSLLLLPAILVISGGCERSDLATPDEPEKALQHTLKGSVNTDAFPTKKERRAYLQVQEPTERFRKDTVLQPKITAENMPEYYSPGYSISSKEACIIAKAPADGPDEQSERLWTRGNPPFPGTGYQKYILSDDSYLMISFDNDIFTNTDYYYTSGLTLEFFHPFLSRLPSRSLLPSAGTGSLNCYSVSLTQTLFTPVDPDKTAIQQGDRPFASYLVLGLSNISNNAGRRLRITSRLDLGVIGPAALGGAVQKTIHDIEPVGWQNQISNDLVLNYMIQAEKGILTRQNILLYGKVAAEAGTLRSNLSAGPNLRISNAAGYFESPFLRSQAKTGRHRLNYYILVSADAKLVGYDATLQGGLTSHSENVYHIPSSDIARLVVQGRLGAGLNYRSISVEAEHIYLSREFNSGKPHMWTRLKTVIKL